MLDILFVMMVAGMYIVLLYLLAGLAVRCFGTMYDDGWRTCPTCKGTGFEDVHPNSPLWGSECEDCYGFGEFYVPTIAEMG